MTFTKLMKYFITFLPNHEACDDVSERFSLRLNSFPMPVNVGITIAGNETHMPKSNNSIFLTAVATNFFFCHENKRNFIKTHFFCIIFYLFVYLFKHFVVHQI